MGVENDRWTLFKAEYLPEADMQLVGLARSTEKK